MQKLIFIDLDGTLSPQSTWFLLNLCIGITKEEDHALFEQYLNNTLNYTSWNRALVELYRSRTPVSKEAIIACAQAIELRSDALETITCLKEKGYHVVILSGSVDLIVETIAQKVGAHAWRSTARLVFDDTNSLVDIVASGDEAPAKELLAIEYAKEHGYVLEEAFAVEDGGNGEALFKRVKGILLGENKQLTPLAWKKIATFSELVTILP